MKDMTVLNSILTRPANALDWLAIVYVASMFLVAIWRPNRIVGIGAFRLSVIVFAMSVMTPGVIGFGWNFYRAQDVGSASQSSFNPYYPSPDTPGQTEQRMVYITQCASDASRVMLGMAIALGLLSLLERPGVYRREQAATKPIEIPADLQEGRSRPG
jgi:hypothetical protein